MSDCHSRSPKIFGEQSMTHLMIAIVAYLLLLAVILMFNHGAHMH